jgi:hypothetical protein
MAFSKTGMYLATGGNDKKVIVWEAVAAGSSDMHSAQDSSSVATAADKSDLPDEGGVGMLSIYIYITLYISVLYY